MTKYQIQAIEFLKMTNTQIKSEYLKHDKHFHDDKYSRNIYKVTISRGKKRFSFNFGCSLANPAKPSEYDILSCLTKYDPETFDNFCGDYGYSNDSISALKIYKAVLKEYNNVCRIWSEEELEYLREIK